jgi:hypothetical protein
MLEQTAAITLEHCGVPESMVAFINSFSVGTPLVDLAVAADELHVKILAELACARIACEIIKIGVHALCHTPLSAIGDFRELGLAALRAYKNIGSDTVDGSVFGGQELSKAIAVAAEAAVVVPPYTGDFLAAITSDPRIRGDVDMLDEISICSTLMFRIGVYLPS